MSVRTSWISLSDLRPKLRYLSISASDFTTRSPMVLMSAWRRQFDERTESSSSSTLRSRRSRIFCFSSSTTTGSSSSITSSKSTNRWKWSRRILAENASASFGRIEPSVQISSVILS